MSTKQVLAGMVAAAKRRLCSDIVLENQIVALSAKSPRSTTIPAFPKENAQWPELEKAISFTMAEMDCAMKSSKVDRLSIYEPTPHESLSRGISTRSSPPRRGFVVEQ